MFPQFPTNIPTLFWHNNSTLPHNKSYSCKSVGNCGNAVILAANFLIWPITNPSPRHTAGATQNK